MADLIPLAELLAEIDREIKRVPACTATLQRARSIAMTIPTVDAEPVVHARWIQHDLRVIQSECSACRTSFNVRMEYGLSTKYCPHCGAKMDGEKEAEHE